MNVGDVIFIRAIVDKDDFVEVYIAAEGLYSRLLYYTKARLRRSELL